MFWAAIKRKAVNYNSANNATISLINEYESDIEDAMEEIFYENIPEKSKFKSALKELKKSIKEMHKIPLEKRTYEEWQ